MVHPYKDLQNSYGGMTYSGQSASGAQDIMEHLQYLNWYCEQELAYERLHLIAFNIDDPLWIKDKEEEWLNEPEYWNGFYGRRPKNRSKREQSEWE